MGTHNIVLCFIIYHCETSQCVLVDVQYQRSESDGEISITGGSDRSDGKNVYQLGKHDITML